MSDSWWRKNMDLETIAIIVMYTLLAIFGFCNLVLGLFPADLSGQSIGQVVAGIFNWS